MKVPLKWLKEYVEINIGLEELCYKLNSIGIPVERVEHFSTGLKNVVSGKILTLEKHPQADKLKIAKIDTGEILQIVTAASSIKEGDIVAVAKVGAQLAGGGTIKKMKFKGITSEGMMCSASELGIPLKDLPLLPPHCSPGEDINSIFNLEDDVLVLETFANRPDLLSILGIAREIARVLGVPLHIPPKDYQESEEKIEDYISVQVEDMSLCPRYTARVIKDVKINPSPFWMQLRLQAAGIRPINNIVDITNYVMLEYGHPLHAFDCALITGKKIIIRKACPGERLVTIDSKERSLDEDILLIADIEKPIAIAGIMGGIDTEISDNTRIVLLESALFNPSCIRKGSIKLGLQTESSRRFEKGLDIFSPVEASQRAAYLMKQTGAKVVQGIADVFEKLPPKNEIYFRPQRANQLLGTNISSEEMKKYLTALDFQVYGDEKFLVTPPHFRQDINEETDLIEEIARCFGYENIEATLPQNTTLLGKNNPQEAIEENIKGILNSMGLSEVISYSLVNPEFCKLIDPTLTPPPILNPLSSEQRALRPSLLTSIIPVISRNLNLKNKNQFIFEIGKTFFKNEETVSESRSLSVAVTGSPGKGEKLEFSYIKGIAEALFHYLGVSEKITFHKFIHPSFHQGRCAEILIEKEKAGIIGQLNPFLLEKIKIDQEIYYLEANLEIIWPHINLEKKFIPLPRYPEITRDIALILDDEITSAEVIRIIKNTGKPLVEDVKLFDFYKGPQIPTGKKSLAYSITYRATQKTLTDNEVNKIHTKIARKLKEKLKAQIRE